MTLTKLGKRYCRVVGMFCFLLCCVILGLQVAVQFVHSLSGKMEANPQSLLLNNLQSQTIIY